MRHLTAIIRVILFTIVTLVTFLVYAAGLLVSRLFRARYEPWRNLCMRYWAAAVLFIFNLKVNVLGRPPQAPFFMVSNHLSYIDMLIFYRLMNTTFVATKEVESWPVLGPMVKMLGVIFIDRRKKTDLLRVNQLVPEALNAHQGLVLFPEGTTSLGVDVQPFRPPLLETPADRNIPVHYCSISYKTTEGDLPASESVCWWEDISFGAHMFKLARNRSVLCTVNFGGDPVQVNDRKVLAVTLHKKVKQNFIPVKQPEPGISV